MLNGQLLHNHIRHTLGRTPGRKIFKILQRSTPSRSAALKAWSDAVGKATPVTDWTHSAAARRLDAACKALLWPLVELGDDEGSLLLTNSTASSASCDLN
jgi:hypothetical protein